MSNKKKKKDNTEEDALVILEQMVQNLRKVFKKQKAQCKDLENQLCQLKGKNTEKRSTKRRRPNEFSTTQKKQIASKQKWKCKCCKELLKADYQVDHIKPICKGGSSDISNGQALCPACHKKKTEIDDIEILRY